MPPIAHSPPVQRLGKAMGRFGRRLSDFLLDLIFPVPAPRLLPAPDAVKKVLLVRPNFRIGNALLATPLIEALQTRFPDARVDVLTADSTRSIFERSEAARIHTTTRRSILRPWIVFSLFRTLRREGYDVALEGGMGSFSGGLWCWLCGAAFRVGVDGRNRRFINVPLGPVHPRHAYDWAVEVATRLGSSCSDHPVLRALSEDREEAAEVWREAGVLQEDGSVRPYIATFVGGHLEKRWAGDRWVALIRALEERGLPVLVLVGPEEIGLAKRIAAQVDAGACVVAPGSLGRLAVLLGEARVVVSTDSGPMHLAVAAGATLLTLVLTRTSLRYTPRGERDATLVAPSADEVLQAVIERLPPGGTRAD